MGRRSVTKSGETKMERRKGKIAPVQRTGGNKVSVSPKEKRVSERSAKQGGRGSKKISSKAKQSKRDREAKKLVPRTRDLQKFPSFLRFFVPSSLSPILRKGKINPF